MKQSGPSSIDRRTFLALGFGACCAFGLAGCGQSSKGSFDDGYAAGYAAAVSDAEAKAKQEEEEKAASTPESGVEYTITSASLGTVQYSGETVLILDVTATNVTAEDTHIYFIGYEISAYQDGKGLTPCTFVEGRDLPDSRTVQAGVSLEGWIAFELIDTTTPVELKAASPYGLTNPQTIDLSTL